MRRARRKIFRDWKIIVEASKEADFDIMGAPRPLMVGNRATPENLDAMTMGQMLSLSGLDDSWSMFYGVCREFLGMTDAEVDNADAAQVVLFTGWCAGELKKLTNLFSKIKSSHTAEEIRAGVERLDYGAFGLVDWYAKRMGITDHDEVMNVPCLRVYQCLKMDSEREEYEKRLAKIYRDKK